MARLFLSGSCHSIKRNTGMTGRHPMWVMTGHPAQRQARHNMRPLRLITLVAIAAAALVMIAGCGGSKPEYCGDVTKLQDSVKSLDVSGGLSSLKTQVQTIVKQAKNLPSSAKDDFPTETAAIKSSFETLQTDVQAINSKPSAQQAITLASDAAAAATSVKNFASASKSKC
jgi:hypothetical protein